MGLICESSGDVDNFGVSHEGDITVVEVYTEQEVLITAHLTEAQRVSLIEALLKKGERHVTGS